MVLGCFHPQNSTQQLWQAARIGTDPPLYMADDEANVRLGLELKERWCKKLLAGEKKVELRTYSIPQEYLYQPVLLLQTPDGSEGKSTLPREQLPAGFPGAHVAGTVIFSGQTVYSSFEQWAADVERHCVMPGSPYSWQQETYPAAALQPVPAMKRVLSSWFQVDRDSQPSQPE